MREGKDVPTSRIGDLEMVWDVAGAPNAEPVLMINGLGASRAGWAFQVPALAETFRVFTFDNRDVGQTGAGSLESYPISQFALDAIGLVETLEIGPVHLIGASMGGAIAQEFALVRPDLTRSLQIVCSWARTDPYLAELMQGWSDMFSAMGREAWSRNTWLWVYTHRWFMNPEYLANAAREAAADPYPQSAEMFARQCGAILAFDALNRLPLVSAPTQIIAGAEDVLTPPRYSAEIASAIPGASYVLLPEVGHGMFWEATDRFNESLVQFIVRSRT